MHGLAGVCALWLVGECLIVIMQGRFDAMGAQCHQCTTRPWLSLLLLSVDDDGAYAFFVGGGG